MTDYQPLTRFLSSVRTAEVSLSFAEVEEVLGQALPRSAHDHQAWWANTSTHSHAGSWMKAGWRTARLNLPSRKVTFVRQPPFPLTPPNSIVLDRALLSPAALRLVERRAADRGLDFAHAVAGLLDEKAMDDRRRLLDRFSAMSPRLETDSTDLIREDRDAR